MSPFQEQVEVLREFGRFPFSLIEYIFSESDPETNRRGKRRQIGMP